MLQASFLLCRNRQIDFHLISQLVVTIKGKNDFEGSFVDVKYKLGAAMMVAGLLLAGCGSDDEKAAPAPAQTETTTAEDKAVATPVDDRLKEPTKDEKCAFCNMKVYDKDNKMGAFTAQAIDEKGKNLFFDDAGCMLNYERDHKVTLEKFVRDYDSKDWIKLEDATIVAGDIKTPMNYGFAYFTQKTAAEKFIADNEGSKIVAVSDIDDKAHEKMKMKMNGEHSDSEQSQGH